MKAMLINAGHRLSGANLGSGLYPNEYQGWGEPNLSDVLDLGGEIQDVGVPRGLHPERVGVCHG